MSADPTSFVPETDFDNSFFDHIDDLLDFPGHNVFVGGRGNSFPNIWNASPFSCFDSQFGHELSAELPIPCKDDVQMEWPSSFVEDSFIDENLFRTADTSRSKALAPIQIHLSSPISVLESSCTSSSSSSTSSRGSILPLSADNSAKVGYGRARTKRARPSTFDYGSAMQLISASNSTLDTNQAFPTGQKKKRNRVDETSNNEINPDPPVAEVRKCLHCEITKTPQWRTGPMGPKTLCNACGVRHKSGRLFPEYRPAASPTFVPSLHSNSHKKVVEMRISSISDDSNA